MIRGKFRCSSVTYYGAQQDKTVTRQFTFTAIYDTSTPENQRFSAATPWAEVKINVSNPEVDFRVSEEYYLDFTPVKG